MFEIVGKKCTAICYATVYEDEAIEAPMAYKALEDIIDSINESVNTIEVLKPVYNYKASE